MDVSSQPTMHDSTWRNECPTITEVLIYIYIWDSGHIHTTTEIMIWMSTNTSCFIHLGIHRYSLLWVIFPWNQLYIVRSLDTTHITIWSMWYKSKDYTEIFNQRSQPPNQTRHWIQGKATNLYENVFRTRGVKTSPQRITH